MMDGIRVRLEDGVMNESHSAEGLDELFICCLSVL